MTSAVQIDGHDVYSMRLALALLGVGSLEAEIDLDPGTTPPSGTVDLVFAVEGEASRSFRVTILPSIGGDDAGRETLGRFRIFAVQGNGALRETIEGTDYADDVDPRLIFEDLLAGEDSDLSSVQSLSPLQRWATSGTRKAALTRLASRLELGWRVLPSGAVRVAPEDWPAYATAAPLYTSEPDAYGLAELALDAPDLLPGMTILRPDARPGDSFRVAEVVYMLDDGAFRASIRVQRPAGGQGPSLEAWRGAVAAALPPLRLFVPHFASVVDQDASTGELGLRLDGRDPPMLTLAAVPFWPGLPGRRIRLPLGARVLVHFVGGSEETPVVLGHEWAGAFDEEKIGDDEEPLAKVGDAVDCGFWTIGPGPAYALAPAVEGVPGAVPVTGTIVSGSVAGGKVKG
jgi:hypothetical protein